MMTTIFFSGFKFVHFLGFFHVVPVVKIPSIPMLIMRSLCTTYYLSYQSEIEGWRKLPHHSPCLITTHSPRRSNPHPPNTFSVLKTDADAWQKKYQPCPLL